MVVVLSGKKIRIMLKMFRNTIYIRLRAQKISLLHVESGEELSLLPEVAIETLANGKKAILAVGADASSAAKTHPNVVAVNGFQHPRTLIADFTAAEQTLKYCIRALMPKTLFAPSPIIIFHPLEKEEGGYTQVEMRAFEELCTQVGARKTYIKVGAELSKEELQRISYEQ